MNKPSLHFFFEPHGSIGEVSQDLLPYLKDEFDITIEGEDVPQELNILLCHFVNSKIVESSYFKKFRKKVLIQPIDGTVITEEYVNLFNQFDLIFTPGIAGKTIMETNGVTTKILVVRNFYKDNIFSFSNYNKIKNIPDDKIVFYHESTFHPRKGIDTLLHGYVEAFSDTSDTNDVVLVLKDNDLNDRTYKTTETLKREIMSLQKTYKNPAKIIKITQNVSWDIMKKLWAKANIYVSFAKIEGFGIPLLRMAALEKPIITLDSNLCGYRDWLTRENSYLVPTKKVTSDSEFMQIYDLKRTQWSIPRNMIDVISTFRQCLQDYKNKTLKLVDKEVVQTMTLENIANIYVKELKTI